MSGVLLLTQSRSSFGGIFISAWLLIITALRRNKLVVILITLSMLVAIVGIFSLVGSDKIPYTDGESRNKLAGRVTVFWTPAVKTIQQYPVFGIGMNNARKIPKIGYYQAHFHNQFLHTAAELGLPGLVAYLGILVGAAYMCFRVWKYATQGWVRLAALGLGCGQLALLTFGILDTLPLGSKVGQFFWFSLGLIAALFNHMSQAKSEDDL
jgi:putative inorganic carbon (HCO3(-)) transporter